MTFGWKATSLFMNFSRVINLKSMWFQWKIILQVLIIRIYWWCCFHIKVRYEELKEKWCAFVVYNAEQNAMQSKNKCLKFRWIQNAIKSWLDNWKGWVVIILLRSTFILIIFFSLCTKGFYSCGVMSTVFQKLIRT